jgi:hypothetical protein
MVKENYCCSWQGKTILTDWESCWYEECTSTATYQQYQLEQPVTETYIFHIFVSHRYKHSSDRL